MARTTQLPKSVTEATPVLAVVGAADVTVERVRAAAKNATALQGELEARLTKAQADAEARLAKVQADAEARFAKVQSTVEARVAKAQTAVEARRAKVQSSVEAFDAKAFADQAQQAPALAVSRALELAGKVEKGYEDLAERGKKLVDRLSSQKATQDLISQGKVTLSRTKAAVTTARKAVDTTTAAAIAAVGIGVQEAAEAVTEAEKVVEGHVVATEEAAKTATATARKRTAGTRSAVKGATTSARKTAAAAKKAAKTGADKVGN
ncbi:hypothetical protein [Kineosporia sp. A_224]|uniref:hypothetical protein n=1 Tax=Kineosporia sp. A_224 TaxID=1962180 RepID=UPI000B4AF158|nr:hypothetical protein [Kineosporia sp. A_224]